MPNWVTNTIKIKTKNVEEVIEKLFTDGDFDFDKIIPSPKRIEDCPKNYICKGREHIQKEDDRPWFNWYEWNYRFWGTKWGACETEYEKSDNGISISFDTAWAPPIPIFDKLIEMFGKNIHIRSYEEWGDLCYKV